MDTISRMGDRSSGDTAARYRHLAQAFSTRVVRQLATKHGPAPLERIAPLLGLVHDGEPLSAAFEAAYRLLQVHYPCEYIYKNELLTQQLGTPATANAITELHVRMSLADVVVIGDGVGAVYEIKTPFDSFTRLELQLHDYGHCFENLWIVTSPAAAPRAKALSEPHVGVIARMGIGEFAVVRSALGGIERIDPDCLFTILRRGEVLAILARQLNYVPDQPPATLYHRTRELFCALDRQVAYREFLQELSGRDAKQHLAAQAAGLPAALQATIYGTGLTPTAWARLGATLAQPVAAFAAA